MYYVDARRDCENRGGYLVTLTSSEEQSFVWTNVGAPGWAGAYWLGYSDAFVEGQWEWITGEIAVTDQNTVYANWASGEPNDGAPGGQDGGALLSDGTWDDINIAPTPSQEAGYICELDSVVGAAVGGIAEYPDVAGTGDGLPRNEIIMAAVTAMMAFAAGAWYARRRWLG